MRVLLVTLMMCALALAGCASGGGKDKTDGEDPTAGLGLEATETTGIIRGVVVDARIVPLPGAVVTIATIARNATSNEDGGFGFDGLEPGTYFLNVAKAGFKDVQQSVDVVAGKDDPPIVRVLLEVDQTYVSPYYEAYTLDGFIQCGMTTSVVAYAACSQPNGCNPGFGVCATNDTYTQDHFNQFIAVANVPTWIQHEVVWDATQSTGNMLNLAMRTGTIDQWNDGGYGADIGGDIIGTSPLVGIINTTYIQQLADRDDPIEIGVNGTGLAPAVFTGGMEGTQVCFPDTPATNPICSFATGAAVNQKFTMYTHIFYGYAPPEGWHFSESGTVPLPP
jgi:hypothetical protein